jgi:shikimate dehydrogenase
MTMQINGQTRLIGFFGSTYKTSKMYAMYNAAIEALAINYLYVPFAVDNLAKAVEGVKNLGIAAIGVTIPYKIEIMQYLDELDADAKRIGAVNVVVNKDGRLVGSNTDGLGALKALEEETEVKGKNITLIGAGGAARSIAFALSDAGGKLTILNRTEEIDLAESLGSDVGCPWGDLSQLESCLAQADIVINTTPIGMANTPLAGRSLVPEQGLRAEMTVMDIVNKPKETKLLQDAGKKGCNIVYGDRMLLWQGVYKFKIYTGIEPPVEVMEEAMEKIK